MCSTKLKEKRQNVLSCLLQSSLKKLDIDINTTEKCLSMKIENYLLTLIILGLKYSLVVWGGGHSSHVSVCRKYWSKITFVYLN